MKIALILVLILSGAALLILRRRPQPVSPVMTALAALPGTAAAIALAFLTLLPQPTTLADGDRLRLQASAGYRIAEELASSYQNEKIVILMRDSDSADRREALIRAIRSKLGDAAPVEALLVRPQLADRMNDEDRPGYQVLIRARDYDDALSGSDAEIVIFDAELPPDAVRMRLWKHGYKRKVFVLNAPRPLDGALQQKWIAGYTILNPEADFRNLKIPAEYDKAFASRYRFVTAE